MVFNFGKVYDLIDTKNKKKYCLKLSSTYRNKEALVIKLNSVQGIKIIINALFLRDVVVL